MKLTKIVNVFALITIGSFHCVLCNGEIKHSQKRLAHRNRDSFIFICFYNSDLCAFIHIKFCSPENIYALCNVSTLYTRLCIYTDVDV